MSPRIRSGPRTTPSASLLAAQNLVGALVLVGLLTGCGDGGRADPEAFCAGVDELRDDDPFAELAVASPGEMRDAFAELADAAGRIEAAAPAEAAVQAERYLDAIDALRDELAGAAYDPTRVDTLRYGDAVSEYTDAAISLDNAADAAC